MWDRIRVKSIIVEMVEEQELQWGTQGAGWGTSRVVQTSSIMDATSCYPTGLGLIHQFHIPQLQHQSRHL